MDILIGLALLLVGTLGIYFAIILLLLVITNYAGFLVIQRSNPSVFANAFKYVFLKSQDESISLTKVFKVSVSLTIATLISIAVFSAFKG